MSKIRTIYIAGPYTTPDPCENTHIAIGVAENLISLGFVPHLTHFWHTMRPHTYDFWLQYDLVWMEKCDAVFRIEGASIGADREVARAKELGIPVFNSYSMLVEPMAKGGDT
jgi:hypothetical protein